MPTLGIPPDYHPVLSLNPANTSATRNFQAFLPVMQSADTTFFAQRTPQNTISIGKSAKYGAGVGAGLSLLNIGLMIAQGGRKFLEKSPKIALLGRVNTTVFAVEFGNEKHYRRAV